MTAERSEPLVAAGVVAEVRRSFLVPSTLLLPVVVFASGFAGLGYELIWTRMLAVALGHEIPATLAVLAAFFSGLGLGAFAFGRRILRSSRPGRWYAALELVIACWALCLIALIPQVQSVLPGLIGVTPSPARQWILAFAATFCVLLPATVAMGATLPALERVAVRCLGLSRQVGAVYALNTAGAVAGIVLTTFWLAPAIGFSSTLLLCAGVNLACALSMRWLAWPTAAPAIPAPVAESGEQTPRWALITLFTTGLLGISYEVLVIRVLSEVLEDTVYSFAVVLAVYLLGSSLGAALYQRWLRHRSNGQTLNRLLAVTALCTTLGVVVLFAAEWTHDALLRLFTAGSSAGMAAELVLAASVFLLPAAAMGALFSHLAQSLSETEGLGRALAFNTLGAALAPVVAGVVLFPLVGATWALLLVPLGYLLLQRQMTGPGRVLFLFAAILAITVLPPLRFVSLPPGGALLEYRGGVMASLAVVEDASGHRLLKVNNHFAMGSTSSGFADHRQTHLPLLFHPDPREALFLGIGTGMSVNAAQHHQGLQTTAVELLPEALDLLEFFGTDPMQNDWIQAPRLVTSDARRFVVATHQTFDVVIADLFHPARDGAGSLYTHEHFLAIRERLAEGGLFCQWLPLFQMDLETLRTVARTFITVFPEVQVHVPHFSLQQPIIGFVGSRQPLEFRSDWLYERVQSRRLQTELVNLRMNSEFAFLGGYLGNRDALAAFAGAGSLNSDDRPLVTYQAPHFAYALAEDQAGHGQRLVEVVRALAGDRGQPLAPVERASEFARRMEAYWMARDDYLQAGLGVDPWDDLPTMLAKTRDPLLAVVRKSPDFTPAYVPLLSMAEALAQEAPEEAIALLRALNAAAPERPEALALLEVLKRG